jgi:hypothetical protein
MMMLPTRSRTTLVFRAGTVPTIKTLHQRGNLGSSIRASQLTRGQTHALNQCAITNHSA